MRSFKAHQGNCRSKNRLASGTASPTSASGSAPSPTSASGTAPSPTSASGTAPPPTSATGREPGAFNEQPKEPPNEKLKVSQLAAIKLLNDKLPQNVPMEHHIVLSGLRAFDSTFKQAYKLMAGLVHPDKNNGSEDATEAFKVLANLNDQFSRTSTCIINKNLEKICWMTDAEWEFLQAWNAFKNMPVPPRTKQPPAPAPSSEPGCPGATNVKITGIEIRTEFINKKSILDFLGYTAARRIFNPEKGCVATHLKMLLRRGQLVKGHPDLLKITVCSYRVMKNGLKQRRQSGINVFEGDVPPHVSAVLAHELKGGIPKGMVGKSVFSVGGKLVRTVCRWGLKGVDIDAQRCYTTLRDAHAPPELARPRMKEYLADIDAVNQFITDETKSCKEAKHIITAIGNGQRVDPAMFSEKAYAWLKDFQDENIAIMEHNAKQMPEIRSKFPDGRPGLLSFQSDIDQDNEAAEMDKIDDVNASNEWDGIFFFLDDQPPEKKLAECQAKMKHLTLKIKPYEDPLVMGQRKYPFLDWTTNNMAAVQWLDVWDRCLDLVGSAERCRVNDLLFGDFLRGRGSGLIISIPGTNTYEMWDDDERCWCQDVTDNELATKPPS